MQEALALRKRQPKSSKRAILASTTALTALVAMGMFSPVAVQEAWAVCSPDPYPGGGQVTVACGSGDYNDGIRYDDATTSTGTSSIFGFMNSQVLGPNSGFDRSAVVISSNEVGHTIDINIMQEDGAEPSFAGRNWTNNPFTFGDRTSNGFQVHTKDDDSKLTFDVNQNYDQQGENNGSGASFQGGNVTATANIFAGQSADANSSGIVLGTMGGGSGIEINVSNIDSAGGAANAFGEANSHGFAATTQGAVSGISFWGQNGSFEGGETLGAAGYASGMELTTAGSNSGIDFTSENSSYIGGSGVGVGDGRLACVSRHQIRIPGLTLI